MFIRITSLLLLLASRVRAQAGSDPSPPGYQYANFSPSMAIIIVVLISALFFMGFFSIYIRHCSDTSSSATVRAIGASLRGRAAPRGLSQEILESFPTFGYAEVKDKKIGKGALECAVCLNEFEDDDTCRLIPKCDHVFHPECIDAWLESHVTCPVCRANLTEPVEPIEPEQQGEVSIVIAEEPGEEPPVQTVDRVESMNRERPPRSQSVRAKVRPNFPRSHTTGHSMVQPGENVDRFTLRLPENLRKEVMNRALNRTSSCLVVLPAESSSRRGYRTGFGRSFKRVDPVAKSDRWVFTMAPPFLSRGPSMRSPRGEITDGEGSTSAKTPRGVMKLASFKCLEPKGDETYLIRGDSSRPPV